MKNSSSLSIILVACAVASWALVWLFSGHIARTEETRAEQVADAQRFSGQQASLLRAQALVQETAQQRSQIDTMLSTDVVSLADMLTEAGRGVGVKVKLSGALPETAPAAAPSASLTAVGFVVQADGTFSNLMRAAERFQALSLGSSLTRLDIQKNPDGGPGAWHMNAYIIVYTTTAISS